MKSVGEAMSLGRNFIEALGKVMRSLETTRAGFWTAPDDDGWVSDVLERLRTPTEGRLYDIELALRMGATRRGGRRGLRCRPLVRRADQRPGSAAPRAGSTRPVLDEGLLRRAKHNGLSDRQIASLRPELAGEAGVRTLRAAARHPPGVQDRRHLCRRVRGPARRTTTRSYELDPAAETEVAPQTEKPKVLILGGGPNRIGQGIEFDYCCVHAASALQRGRLRDRHGQLQPRDGVHRLRHRRPAVLRAADLRGRARGLSRRSSPGRAAQAWSG